MTIAIARPTCPGPLEGAADRGGWRGRSPREALRESAVFEYETGAIGASAPLRVEVVHVGRHEVFYRREPNHPMGSVGRAAIARFLAILSLPTSRLVEAA